MIPPRLLFLANALEPDAPTRLLLAIASHMKREENAECRFVALSRGGALQQDVQDKLGNSEVIGLRTNWGNAAVLKSILRDYRPDLFHATLARPAILGVTAAAAAGVRRIVITQNGTHEWREGSRFAALVAPWLFRRASRFASSIVAVSNAVRDDLERKGVPAHKLSVIYNGVDTERFSVGLQPGRSLPDNTFIAGAAGNLRKIKGYDVLIRAAALVSRQSQQIGFVIHGEGEERPNLEALIAELSLKDRVSLAGRVEDMPTFLRSCDVFVQPSRQEAFGLATAEAMSCGIPVIASLVGGLPELVTPDCGILVPPDNPEALAEAILDLASDSERRKQFGLAARQRMITQFSVRQMCLRYADLYHKLLIDQVA